MVLGSGRYIISILEPNSGFLAGIRAFIFPRKATSQKYIPGGLTKSGQIAKRVFKKWIYGGHHASIHYYQKVIDRLISGFPEYGFIWLHGDPKYVRKYLAANITVYIPRGLIFRGDDAFRLLFSQEFRLLVSQELALLFFCTMSAQEATMSALSRGNNVCSLKKQQCLLKKQQCLLSQEATMSALSRMEPRTKGLSQGRARPPPHLPLRPVNP